MGIVVELKGHCLFFFFFLLIERLNNDSYELYFYGEWNYAAALNVNVPLNERTTGLITIMSNHSAISVKCAE